MNRPWLCRTAGLAASIFWAPMLLADVPAAMDRVPTDAPIVVSMKNVAKFYSSVSDMAKALSLPPGPLGGLQKAGELLKMEGLNADGSAAVAMMALPDEDGEEGPVVMVVPVKDFGAFAKALGGEGGAGVHEVKFEDKPAFVKDLGGGFAALSPKKDLVEKFEGKSGSGRAFETMMGANGKAVAESSDAFVVANMEKLGPKMKDGITAFKEQMEMMAAMSGAGQGNKAGMEAMSVAMDGFVRDASAGVLGIKAGQAGLTLDLATQFREGSEYAGYFKSKGNASSLSAALPNPSEGFLFAFAMDTSAPGIKQIFKNMLAITKKDPEAAKLMTGLNPIDQIDKVDGQAFCMGTSPALMGGLFLNTSMFVKTADPAGYVKTIKDAMGAMNGKSNEGMTYQTAFESGAAKVGETPVNTWSLKFQADPNNPMGQQIAQIQMMMFGPMGLNGFIAPAKQGVVATFSKNSELMAKALEAANAGKGGLADDAGVKSVAANLPAGRSMEVYIGVKSILETAQGFMGMMGGGGGGNFNIPQDLPPIGIGGTTDGGGLRASLFVPTQVISTIKGFSESMNGGPGGAEEDEMEAPKKKDKTGQPKF